jgi:hypothetical protein
VSKARKGFAVHDDDVCDGMRGALCSHQDPNNCDRERDCPAFVALPKTTSERVAAMRAARDALGLKRLELYAHPDDWPAIKALAEKLQRRRAKLAAPRAG